MPAKRPTARPAPTGPAASPLLTAGTVLAAVGFGLYLLIDRGRVAWPPADLLANLSVMAGALALAGPAVLARREGGGGLGELLWLTGGALIWVNNLAALTRGEARSAAAWVIPLGARPMGLTMLAVLLAGWRSRGLNWSWSWSDVTGWILGLYWVGMAAADLIPGRPAGLARL